MTARVLVVDDLLPNVKLLEAKLRSEYFDVLTAQSGEEALEIVARDEPDIVLLDVMMPGMDGFEVCERLKNNTETMHVPVVIITALSDSADRLRGLDAGADDFLTKPVNDTALFARVRSLTRLKMLTDEWRRREQTSDQLGVMAGDGPMNLVDTSEPKVLILEDNPLDARKISETLSAEGGTCEVSNSVNDAMSLLRSDTFELVVMNLRLKSDDALRFASLLRAQETTRNTPILVIAEEEDTARLAKGLDLGINDYLMRPIDRQELMARARTQIRRFRYQHRLRQNYERSLTMALTDSLTGLYNRRYLTAHLSGIINQAILRGRPLAVMMFDIDYFKSINDTHGHAAGDEVLIELSKRVLGNLRSVDTVARVGGEEFVVVMPDTELSLAGIIAERLRTGVCDIHFSIRGADGKKGLVVSVSIGIAMFDPETDSADSIMRRADEALYEAKRCGRNRTVCIEADGFSEIGSGDQPSPAQ